MIATLGWEYRTDTGFVSCSGGSNPACGGFSGQEFGTAERSRQQACVQRRVSCNSTVPALPSALSGVCDLSDNTAASGWPALLLFSFRDQI